MEKKKMKMTKPKKKTYLHLKQHEKKVTGEYSLRNGVRELHLYEYCRLCFSTCQDPTRYTPIAGQKEDGPRQKEIQKMLKNLIPTLDLTLTRNPGICSPCEDALFSASNLISRCKRNQNALLTYKSQHEGPFINIHDVVESNNSCASFGDQNCGEVSHLINNKEDYVEKNTYTNKRRTVLKRTCNKKQKLCCTYDQSNTKEIKKSNNNSVIGTHRALPKQKNLNVNDSVTKSYTSKKNANAAQPYSKIYDSTTNLLQTTNNSANQDIRESAIHSLNYSASSQLVAFPAQFTKSKQVHQPCPSTINKYLDTSLFPTLLTVEGATIFPINSSASTQLLPAEFTESKRGQTCPSTMSKNLEEANIFPLNHSASTQIFAVPFTESKQVQTSPSTMNRNVNKFPTLMTVGGATIFPINGSASSQLFAAPFIESKHVQPCPSTMNRNLDTSLFPTLVGGATIFPINDSASTQLLPAQFPESNQGQTCPSTMSRNLDTSLFPLTVEGANIFPLNGSASTQPFPAQFIESKQVQPCQKGGKNLILNPNTKTYFEHKEKVNDSLSKNAQRNNERIDNHPNRVSIPDTPLSPPLLKHINLYLPPNYKVLYISKSANSVSNKSTLKIGQIDKKLNSTKNLDSPLSPPLSEQGNINFQPYFNVCHTSTNPADRANYSSNNDIQVNVGNNSSDLPQVKKGRNTNQPIRGSKHLVTPISPALPQQKMKANGKMGLVSKTLKKKPNNFINKKDQGTNKTIDNKPRFKHPDRPLFSPSSEQDSLYVKPSIKICDIMKNLNEKSNKIVNNTSITNFSHKNGQKTDGQIDNQPNRVDNSENPLSSLLPEQGLLNAQPYFTISYALNQNSTDRATNFPNKDSQATLGKNLYCPTSAELLDAQFTETKQERNDCQASKGRNLVVIPLSPSLLQQENLDMKSNTKTSIVSKNKPNNMTTIVSKNKPNTKTSLVSKNKPNNMTTIVSKNKPNTKTSLVSKNKPNNKTSIVSKNTPNIKTSLVSNNLKKKPNNSSNTNTQRQRFRQIDCHSTSIRKLKRPLSPPQKMLDNYIVPQEFNHSLINSKCKDVVENNETKERQGSFKNINILIKSEPVQIDDESDLSLSLLPEPVTKLLKCDIAAITKQEETYAVKKNVSSSEIMIDGKPVEVYYRSKGKSHNTSLMSSLKKQGEKFVNSNTQISSWKAATKKKNKASNEDILLALTKLNTTVFKN